MKGWSGIVVMAGMLVGCSGGGGEGKTIDARGDAEVTLPSDVAGDPGMPDALPQDLKPMPDEKEGGQDREPLPDAADAADAASEHAADIQADLEPDLASDGPADLPPSPDAQPDAAPDVQPDVPEPQYATITEPFDDAGKMDPAQTTAAWGEGKLTPKAANFGDGSDGPFAPTQDTVLDAGQSPFQFTSFHIPKGVTVTAAGTKPLEIWVQGDALIEGTLAADGGDGQDALGMPGGSLPAGGKGVAGGQDGGAGGPGGVVPGHDGSGPGAGKAGQAVGIITFVASGGGAGFGAAGEHGYDFTANEEKAGAGGPAYGDEQMTVLQGGSGGGGGGPLDYTPDDPLAFGDGIVNEVDQPGAGGGAGGGAILVRAGTWITVFGRISADGGDGGMGDFSGGGGGGSGGALVLETAGDVVLMAGVLSARGGQGNIATDTNQLADAYGGDGGGGRIVLRTGVPMTEGIVFDPEPTPTWRQLDEEIQGGDGEDGVFAPAVSQELSTDGGPHYFSSVTIPAGVTVTAVGSLPLIMFSQGNMDISGTLAVNGGKGGMSKSMCCNQPGPPVAGAGGAAGPGGYAGGAGSDVGDAENGFGPGGGHGSLLGAAFAGGGGGGSFGGLGQVGGCPEVAAPGQTYGTEDLDPLEGGSGGGGAGYADVAGPNPGSGGGGGGGAVMLQAAGSMLLSGTISALGGTGGDAGQSGNGGSFGAGGGGGSGGGILVVAQSVRNFGKYEALGGPAGTLMQGGGCSATKDVPGQGRGGRGGDGRIRFETGAPLGFVYADGGSLYLGEQEGAWETTAVSLFYDTQVACPDYVDFEVVPPEAAGLVSVQFEGAQPQGAIPDPATLTGWQDSLDALDCLRLIRFKLEFLPWPDQTPAPVVDEIVIHYALP